MQQAATTYRPVAHAVAPKPAPVVERIIAPQSGFQSMFLASPADIVIGGGAAGSGKTFALLMETMRHLESNGKFGAVCFRRTFPQIKNEGGLWDTAQELYPHLRGKANENNLEWSFPSGARVKFNHLQHEKNIYDYQGSQIPLICFDELTHFSEKMFFYLLSRNRSTCGVQPYVRATCNPDPESWVARLIDWWLDKDGWPIDDRAGVLRYFTRDNGNFVWGNTKDEVLKQIPHILRDMPPLEHSNLVKSLTFIPGTIYENTELMEKNPQYLGALLAMDEATKMQLLKGNWRVKPDAESMVQYAKMLDAFSNEHVGEGKRYITADIALHGSDMFVIFVWSGLRVIDCVVVHKTDGAKVEAMLKELARTYAVPQSHIAYDADGIGAYLKGYLANAYSFNNGSAAIKTNDKALNYKNLKTQCYYMLAERINAAQVYVMPKVAATKVGDKYVRDCIVSESRAIKKHKPDGDGKLQIIPKEQMKNALGHSPDFMDALMMRMVFEIKPQSFAAPKVRSKHN